jgi:hypothetical protein
LLDHDGSPSNASPAYQLVNLDPYEVTTTELAVDRKIEEGAITEAVLLLQKEAYSPYLLGQERPLGT